jgi:hypothetical protein
VVSLGRLGVHGQGAAKANIWRAVMLAVVAVKGYPRRLPASLGLEVQVEPVDGGCRRQAPSQCPTVLRTVQGSSSFLAGAACVKETLRWCRGGLSLVLAVMAVDLKP